MPGLDRCPAAFVWSRLMDRWTRMAACQPTSVGDEAIKHAERVAEEKRPSVAKSELG